METLDLDAEIAELDFVSMEIERVPALHAELYSARMESKREHAKYVIFCGLLD
jgi:hypothetical protein